MTASDNARRLMRDLNQALKESDREKLEQQLEVRCTLALGLAIVSLALAGGLVLWEVLRG